MSPVLQLCTCACRTRCLAALPYRVGGSGHRWHPDAVQLHLTFFATIALPAAELEEKQDAAEQEQALRAPSNRPISFHQAAVIPSLAAELEERQEAAEQKLLALEGAAQTEREASCN